MTTKYDFLIPGVRPTGIGRNLYLLGTSEDGPYMQPMLINTKEKARKIFGDARFGTLVKAFDEAYDRNKEISIFLMRISGKSATLEVVDINPFTGEFETLLHAETIYAGEKYNQVHFSLEYDDVSEMTSFMIRFENGIFAYRLEDGITVKELTRRVNNDCRAGKHPVMLSTQTEDMPITLILGHLMDVYLSGGENGLDLTRDDLYLECEVAYTILTGQPVDVIVPIDLYVDDIHPAYIYGDAMYSSSYYSARRDYLQLVDTYNDNKVVTYHEQLINFCRQQVALGYMTHGVIGMRPLKTVPLNIENDNTYILRIIEATVFRDRYGFVEYRNGYYMDKGFYVSVVASELIFNEGTENEYVANGAVRYGAIVSGHFETTTNEKLGDDVKLRYELSNQSRYELGNLGIVTFKNSVRKGLVVNTGVTAALSINDYHSIANTRMVQLAIAYMNDAVQKVYESDYVSEMRRVFFEELVKERLGALRDAGIIEKYNYQINFLNDDSMGEVQLQLKTKYSVDGLMASAEIVPEVIG